MYSYGFEYVVSESEITKSNNAHNTNTNNDEVENSDQNIINTSEELQSRCRSIYKQLRLNIIKMILGEYKRTGHFWEQYDDRTGQGMRGHPFTGWTALIINIMNESY